MMLTPDQQGYASEAIALADVCVAYFVQAYPCLRGILTQDEMQSAAYYACASAAKTYDPSRSGVSAYFSRAILHELLKSCKREIKSGMRSPYRIGLEAAERRLPCRKERDCDLSAAVKEALKTLTAADRRWAQAVADGRTLKGLHRETGLPLRQVHRSVQRSLEQLKISMRSRLD